MGYTPPTEIDIGNSADDDGNSGLDGLTAVNKGNPANASGKITSIEIWSKQNLTDCQIATFFVVSGDNLSTRDTHTIGNVTSGGKRTFSGLDITVEIGDYIGIFATQTFSSQNDGTGIWYKGGDNIPCTDITFSSLSNHRLILYGTGTTGSGELTIGDSFSGADSLVKNATKQLAEAWSVADSWVARINLAEAFSVADSLVRSATKQLAEAFSVADSLVRSATKQLAEAFSVVDSFAYTVILHFYETLSVKDSFKRFFYNLYTKITKSLSTYTKTNKSTSTYTKTDKGTSEYTKRDKGRGEE